jgi:predicted nucleic acid-binding protein
VSELVVDTSIWVEFFRGTPLPDLERALADGLVVLAPIVAAELASAPLAARERAKLVDMLRDLPLHETPFTHWIAVGELRAKLARGGLTVSTPDAHVAQCAIDREGLVWSHDRVFEKMAAARVVRRFSAATRPEQ